MRSSEYLCRATTAGQIGSISVRRAKETRDEQKCLVGIEVSVKKHITESVAISWRRMERRIVMSSRHNETKGNP